MQNPRPAYNSSLNQPGQTGQPIYTAQVQAHGSRHPASIYSSPAQQQHQPSQPVSMTHPPNNVPSGTGSMIQNAQNQTGHSQFSHAPVATRPQYIQHQQQSGQPPRQILHNSGNTTMNAPPSSFMNTAGYSIAPLASYTHGQILQISNPNQIPNMSQFGASQTMMHGMLPGMSYTAHPVRQPFSNNPSMQTFHQHQAFMNAYHLPGASTYPATMVAQPGMPQNQNQVANTPRTQQTQFSQTPASNPSIATVPTIKRPRQRLAIIDPSTGKDVLDGFVPGSSSNSPSTAGESATVPTSTAPTTGDSSSNKQQDTPAVKEAKEEPKDSSPQPQQPATPVTQSQPQAPLQQQQKPQQQPPPAAQQQQKPPPPSSQQPPQPQQQQQQQPSQHKSHQQQPSVVTSTVDSKVVESGAKKSTSNVKNEAAASESSSSSGGVGSDIKSSSESVVRPGPPQTESTPTVTTERKPESVIETSTKPVIISSVKETSQDIQQSKASLSSPSPPLPPTTTATDSSDVSKPGVTKYSSSPSTSTATATATATTVSTSEKASAGKTISPVAKLVVESSSSSQAAHDGCIDNVDKKLSEVNLNGDIDQVERDVVSPSHNDASKSDCDSKSVKSTSPIEISESVTTDSIDVDDTMQYKLNGKWQYTREQLYKLSESPCCREQPKLAPNIWETVRAKPNTTPRDFGHADLFYPFPSSANAPRNPMPPRAGAAYLGRCSLDSRIATKKIIPAAPLQDVKLHTTENAWKPELKKKSASDLDEEAKTAELLKTFRGYLNKITPQKYEIIEGKIRLLTIDTEERLTLILNLIFDKAVDEPAFCIQYANLCKYLNTLKVSKINDKGESESVGFWRLLLTKCQQQFERDIYADIDIEGRLEGIAECIDADKKRILEAEFDEEKRRARKKSLGNMKLIGELYRLDMLNVKIMISCVNQLLNPIEEENIECLCTLLRTIGPKLAEDSRSKNNDKALDPLLGQLSTIANDIKAKRGDAAKLSSRVRFLILDILDMRKNDWQERSIQKGDRPKTIDEIHAEVQAQEERAAIEHLQYRENRDRRKNHSDSSFARKSQQGPARPQESIASVIEVFQKQKAEAKQAPSTTPQLGTNFSKWSSGSGTHNQGNISSSSGGNISSSNSSSSNTSRPSQEQKSDDPTSSSSSSTVSSSITTNTSTLKSETGDKKNLEGTS